MEKTKFLKIREVKSPNRANPNDAGIDCFVPKFNKSFIDDLISKNERIFKLSKPGNPVVIGGTYVSGIGASAPSQEELLNDRFGFDVEESQPFFWLPARERVLIPGGIKSRMAAPGRALIAANKSGVASKKGLIFGAQVVDYTYKGEIHINVINTSNEPVKIFQDMKLIQFLEMPVITNEVETYTTAKGVPGVVNITEEAFFEGLENDRGEGGFGSTGK